MSDDETPESRRARSDDEVNRADEPVVSDDAARTDGDAAARSPEAGEADVTDAAAADVDRAIDAPPPEPVAETSSQFGDAPIASSEPAVASAVPDVSEVAEVPLADPPPDRVDPADVAAAAPLAPILVRVPAATWAAEDPRTPTRPAEVARPPVIDDLPLTAMNDPGLDVALTPPAPLAATAVDAPGDVVRVTTTAAPAVAVVKPPRLASLDVFRGLTIAAMVLVNNPGSWGNTYAPLQHAAWHGWTVTDLVFPFFLFIVGCAIPFSLGKRAALDGTTRGTLLGRIWTRALALVLLGILLGASNQPLPWADAPPGFGGTVAVRWLGFIFCYAALLALLTPWPWRRVATWLPVAIAVLLVGYLVTMHFVRAKALANGWPEGKFGGGGFNPDMLRLPGVLQRIGVCYGVAATLALFAGRKTVVLALLVLLAGYSALMLNGRIKGLETRSLEKDDNVARRVDVAVFERSAVNADGKRVVTQKHTYGPYPDPEGLLSTLPAIGTTLIGVLVGWWLRRADRTAAERCAGLLARGVGVACVGVLLAWWLMPVNKSLWTPSYAVLTAGLGMLTLGAIFWVADVQGRRWFFWPLRVMGLNAIAAFVAAGVLVRIARFFPVPDPRGGVERIAPDVWLRREISIGFGHASDWLAAHASWMPTLATPNNESLAYAICFLLVIFALTVVLWACRIFVKV